MATTDPATENALPPEVDKSTGTQPSRTNFAPRTDNPIDAGSWDRPQGIRLCRRSARARGECSGRHSSGSTTCTAPWHHAQRGEGVRLERQGSSAPLPLRGKSAGSRTELLTAPILYDVA